MDFGFSHLSWNVVLFWPLRATVHIWTATWNILSIHLLKHNEKCLLFWRRCQMTAHKGAACLTVMYDAQSSCSVSVWGNQTADIVKIILCHIAPEQSCDSPRGNKTESSLRVKSFMWLFSSQSSSGEAVFNSTVRNLQRSDTDVIIIFRIIFPVIQPPAWQEGSRDIVPSPHQHLQRCSICVLNPLHCCNVHTLLTGSVLLPLLLSNWEEKKQTTQQKMATAWQLFHHEDFRLEAGSQTAWRGWKGKKTQTNRSRLAG